MQQKQQNIIDSWSKLNEMLDQYSAGYLFRGHPQEYKNLQPSLARPDVLPKKSIHGKVTGIEGKAIKEFAKSAHRYLSPSVLPPLRTTEMEALTLQERIEWFVLMQHYGTPTRLLDWTESLFVAAYFAVEKDWKNDENGEIWVCNRDLLRRWAAQIVCDPVIEMLDPHPDRRPPNIDDPNWDRFKTNTQRGPNGAFLHAGIEAGVLGMLCDLRQIHVELLDKKAFQSVVFPVTLPMLTDRMYAQQGWFTVALDPRIDHLDAQNSPDSQNSDSQSVAVFDRYTIPAGQKREFLRKFERVNISRHSLFPGVDGLGGSVGQTLRLDFADEFDPHGIHS